VCVVAVIATALPLREESAARSSCLTTTGWQATSLKSHAPAVLLDVVQQIRSQQLTYGGHRELLQVVKFLKSERSLRDVC